MERGNIMGKTRVLMKSIKFTFRVKKRFIPFFILFFALMLYTIYTGSTLNNYYTNKLMDKKGIKIVYQSYPTYDVARDHEDEILRNIDLIDKTFLLSFIDFGDFKVFGVDFQGEERWVFEAFRPTNLVEGELPKNNREVLVSDHISIQLSSGGAKINAKIGTEFTFLLSNGDAAQFRVVGIFNRMATDPKNDFERTGDEWIAIDKDAFNELAIPSGAEIQVHQIAVLVKGDPLFSPDTTYENVGKAHAKLNQLVLDNGWDMIVSDPPSQSQKLDEYNRDMFLVGGASIAGVITTLGYGYIIITLRRKEIAIYKAIGWDNNTTLLTIFTEIFIEMATAFVLALISFDFYVRYIDRGYVVVSWMTMGLAFLTMFVPMFLVVLLITRKRVLGVKPIELMKGK